MKAVCIVILGLLSAVEFSAAEDKNAVITKDADGNILSLKDKRTLKEILPTSEYDCVELKLSGKGIKFDGEKLEIADLKQRLEEYASLSTMAEESVFVEIAATPGTPMKMLEDILELASTIKPPVHPVYSPELRAEVMMKNYLKTPEGQSMQFRQQNRETLKSFGEALKSSESATLYSLKSKPTKDAKEPNFHNYPILGEMRIENKETFGGLKKLLIAEAAPARREVTQCFEPRHGLILHNTDGTSIGLLICFECSQVKDWGLPDELSKALGSFNSVLRSELNKHLDAQEIPREQAN